MDLDGFMPMRQTLRSAVARVLGATVAVLMLGGCATKGDIRDLRTELRDLAVRQDSVLEQLRREALITQDTLRGQSNQLFDFRGALSGEIQDISQSLSRIEALVGQNQRGIAGVRDQLANMRRPSGATAPVDTTGGVTSSPVTAQPPRSGGDAQSIFNVAVGQFNNGQLTTANAAFQQLLQSYPNSALAPEAQFYVADILSQQKGHEKEALAAFQKIPELYPTAGKVPDALYRIALLQLQLGSKSTAKATLQRIVNTYPKADVAKLAADKLKEIG
jgi:tol-pal system protein YbgF